jgi:predicted MFS family arabinose efflux permease
VSWSVAALGMGIAYSTASLSILEGAAPGEEGNASASLQIAMNLGIALGTGIAGAILALGVASSQPLASSLNQINVGMLAATLATLLAVIRIAPNPLGGHSKP